MFIIQIYPKTSHCANESKCCTNFDCITDLSTSVILNAVVIQCFFFLSESKTFLYAFRHCVTHIFFVLALEADAELFNPSQILSGASCGYSMIDRDRLSYNF